MNERIKDLLEEAGFVSYGEDTGFYNIPAPAFLSRIDRLAELIIKDCIGKIEAYHIPVGNSSSGEIACELTYDALKEIRDDIKENFGVK